MKATAEQTAQEAQTVDFASKRLKREWETMEAMVRIHCRDHHEPVNGICVECRQFLDYANTRLERCRFGAEKPTCSNCPVHCYQATRREQVKAIMRYAGPRMIGEHPIMCLRHWLDGFKKPPKSISPSQLRVLPCYLNENQPGDDRITPIQNNSHSPKPKQLIQNL